MSMVLTGELIGIFGIGFLASCWAALEVQALNRRRRRAVRLRRSGARLQAWFRSKPPDDLRWKGLMIIANAGQPGRDWLERMEEFLDREEAWEHAPFARPIKGRIEPPRPWPRPPRKMADGTAEDAEDAEVAETSAPPPPPPSLEYVPFFSEKDEPCKCGGENCRDGANND